ncbi:MAG TPA: hypothetical protein VI193_02255 [Acidimicrobiia bacterium]
MQKRTAATVGGVVAAMLLVAGIAWASGSDDSPTSTTTPNTSTSVDDNGSSTSVDDNSSSTSLNGSTSTTLEDNTSSTVDDDDTTSSTIDDDDVNDDRGEDDADQDDDNKGHGGEDDDSAVAVADGVHTYQVPGAGSVTINVTGGTLELADVQANTGWTTEVDKAQSDRIKINFRNGESEAEFEAELEHGAITIDIEQGD